MSEIKKFDDRVEGNKMQMHTKKINRKHIKYTSKTISTKTTFNMMKEDSANALFVDYAQMKNFVNNHKEELIKKNKFYTINILTDAGWRAGNPFKGDEEINWFDESIDYDGDGETEDIVAIQILEFSNAL